MKYHFALSCLLASCLYIKANTTEPDQQKLDLRFMNLKNIELDSTRARSLTELDISGNPVTELPAEIKYAKDLKVVRLNYCTKLDLSKLVLRLKQLPALEEIQLNNCNLTYLPLSLTGLKQLKRISASNNTLQELPWNLFYNKDLESLDLANNEIEDIPDDLTRLASLKYLDLSGNPCLNDERLYNSIAQLASLETLRCNEAGKLPTEWTLPKELRSLSVNDCRANFPSKIIGCEKLEELSLQNLSYGDSEQGLSVFTCNNIRQLAFSGRDVSKIPSALANFKKVEKLEIETTKLEGPATDLQGLTVLKSLKLKIDDAASLNKVLKSLVKNTSLVELDLSGSTLNELPSEVGSLQTLQKLTAKNCGIKTISPHVFKAMALNEIDLRGNELTAGDIEKLRSAYPSAAIYYDQLTPVTNTPEPYIRKPFPNITIPSEAFTCDPQKDTVIITSNGTKISIPANSIVDKNGKPIKERVKLDFTYYSDPLEIYASGIPMSAQWQGQQQSFASAGMFKLTATYGKNRSAAVKKGKTLKVDLKSKSPNQSYDFWALDTLARNWVQIGTDRVKKSSQAKIRLKKRYPKMPANPNKGQFSKIKITTYTHKPSKKNIDFVVTVDYLDPAKRKSDSAFYNPYEMRTYEHTHWTYVGADQNKFYSLFHGKVFFDGLSAHTVRKAPKYFTARSKEAVEIRIIPNKEKDCFDIIFSNFSDSAVIEAVPVISTNDPARLQNIDKKLYDKYNKDYANNETHQEARIVRYNKDYAIYTAKMENYRTLMNAFADPNVSVEGYRQLYDQINKNELDSLDKEDVTLNNISRQMDVTGFGIYNCDYFERVENPIVSSPSFTNEEDSSKVAVSRVTVIDLDENAFIESKPREVKLAKDRNYWLFTETNDHKIGFSVIMARDKPLRSIPLKFVSAQTMSELRKKLST